MNVSRDAEFTEFVAARRTRLRQTAYLTCGDWHLAEDLVQTTLTKLYVAWPRLRSDGNVEAFARRTLVNCHTDERRRPWRREQGSLERVDVPASEELPAEDRDALMGALATLPKGQRSMVVLRYFLGLSVEETAADLGCSTGNVKSQTSHALRKLEALLSPEFNDR